MIVMPQAEWLQYYQLFTLETVRYHLVLCHCKIDNNQFGSEDTLKTIIFALLCSIKKHNPSLYNQNFIWITCCRFRFQMVLHLTIQLVSGKIMVNSIVLRYPNSPLDLSFIDNVNVFKPIMIIQTLILIQLNANWQVE